MPARTDTPIGAPCWVDLLTSDMAKSRAFYTELLGWEAEEPAEEFGGYVNFTKDGVRVAGCMAQMPGSVFPDTWGVYLATDDARKTVDAAVAEGAQVVVGPADVGDLGTMAVITDPTGAVIGMWEPRAHRGFGVVDEPGAPVWFELLTKEYEPAIAFYRSVFRWDTRVEGDTAEFRYTTQVVGDKQFAGLMDASGFLPDGAPAHWSVYFGTADTDEAVSKALALGATVVQPAMDTPYGRLATVTDSTGAICKLHSPR